MDVSWFLQQDLVQLAVEVPNADTDLKLQVQHRCGGSGPGTAYATTRPDILQGYVAKDLEQQVFRKSSPYRLLYKKGFTQQQVETGWGKTRRADPDNT